VNDCKTCGGTGTVLKKPRDGEGMVPYAPGLWPMVCPACLPKEEE
jgi:RecJ-like exonuclease